jgi:hypothetical protein
MLLTTSPVKLGVLCFRGLMIGMFDEGVVPFAWIDFVALLIHDRGHNHFYDIGIVANRGCAQAACHHLVD